MFALMLIQIKNDKICYPKWVRSGHSNGCRSHRIKRCPIASKPDYFYFLCTNFVLPAFLKFMSKLNFYGVQICDIFVVHELY